MHVSTAPARFAAIVTAVVGLGALAFGLVLLALAQTGFGDLRLPGVGSVLVALAGVSALFGVVALGAAVGLWSGAAWAVAVAAVVHAIALAGILVAAETGGVGPHIAAGTFLTVAGLLTLTPSLRRPAAGSIAAA
jgi:hypothetical protein